MATALAQPARPVPHRWNTLQLLKGCRMVMLALDALLLLAVVLGTHVHRDAMRVVGKDTAPSIIDAQHIKTSLAAMDADLANELLVPAGMAPPSPGDYDKRRVEASEALIEAARNITYGDKEKEPIETLQMTTGTYERLAQQARDFEDDGQRPMSVRSYRAAGIVMDGTVLPAADDLDKANNDVLEQTYKDEALHSFGARAFLALSGLLMLLALIATQLYLSQRTRRTLNPLLLLASLLTLWLTVYAFASMGREEHDLKVANEDAFTSVHALWRARATAFSANGNESRYLLDPTDAGEYQNDFVAEANALAHIPQGTPPGQVEDAAARGALTPGFTGYLADELNNITFPGEREAAVKTLVAFERYLAIDAQIRQLERSGQHQRAIELCVGTSEGQSDWAFEQFDNALVATLEINQRAFDSAVNEGLAAVSNLEIKAVITAVLIAGLAFLGLAPRIREYQ
jgi:hypothetical protein